MNVMLVEVKCKILFVLTLSQARGFWGCQGNCCLCSEWAGGRAVAGGAEAADWLSALCYRSRLSDSSVTPDHLLWTGGTHRDQAYYSHTIGREWEQLQDTNRASKVWFDKFCLEKFPVKFPVKVLYNRQSVTAELEWNDCTWWWLLYFFPFFFKSAIVSFFFFWKHLSGLWCELGLWEATVLIYYSD